MIMTRKYFSRENVITNLKSTAKVLGLGGLALGEVGAASYATELSHGNEWVGFGVLLSEAVATIIAFRYARQRNVNVDIHYRMNC